MAARCLVSNDKRRSGSRSTVLGDRLAVGNRRGASLRRTGNPAAPSSLQFLEMESLMAIIPTVRCSRMAASIEFYTKVLDFECIDGGPEDGDPSFSVLMREGDRLRCRTIVG